MGSFLKFFREGAVIYMFCMHAPRKSPVELASLLSVNKSQVAMVILSCIGTRQFDWRVPLGRLRRSSFAGVRPCSFAGVRQAMQVCRVQWSAVQEGTTNRDGNLHLTEIVSVAGELW